LLVASQRIANSESHLDKINWEKQLSESQRNIDYGSCHDVVIAAYLGKKKVFWIRLPISAGPLGKCPKIDAGLGYYGCRKQRKLYKFCRKIARCNNMIIAI
jgi:hypothetical protein